MTRAEADPPYFSITPDSARADLGPPVGTAGFAEVARKAAQGRADLVGRGLNPEGRKALHVSRTWLVSGPGWLLRGVLLGKATFEPENEDAQVALFEFFSNLVVRRGTQPAAPGSALALRMPEQE